MYILHCIVLHVATQAYYLISPTNGGVSGRIAAAFSAAVEVCASGSATHQSWSPRRPTADHAPLSTMEPILNYTHAQKTDKTVMSLYLTGHNSRIGLDVVWFMEIIPAISKQQIHRSKPTSLLYVLSLGENYMCVFIMCVSQLRKGKRE